MSARSVASDTLTIAMVKAAEYVADSSQGGPPNLLGQILRIIRDHFRNRVIGDCKVAAPTSASTQATGATGATVVNVDIPAFRCIVNGVQKEFAAAADTALHDTTVYTGVDSTTLTDGRSAIITTVAENAAGTVALVHVKGGAATTGSQVAPTDAQIDAAVTSGAEWIKICQTTINRDGDESITQTQDNSVQPQLAVNQDSEFFNAFND